MRYRTILDEVEINDSIEDSYQFTDHYESLLTLTIPEHICRINLPRDRFTEQRVVRFSVHSIKIILVSANFCDSFNYILYQKIIVSLYSIVVNADFQCRHRTLPIHRF